MTLLSFFLGCAAGRSVLATHVGDVTGSRAYAHGTHPGGGQELFVYLRQQLRSSVGLQIPALPIPGFQSTNSPAGGSCRVTTVIIDYTSLAIGHGTTPVPCHQTNAPWQETDHSDDLLGFQCGDSFTITGILWELNLLNLWVELAGTTVSGTIECLPSAQV